VVIVSKSLCCRTSRGDIVKAASRSISSSSSRGNASAAGGSIACAIRAGSSGSGGRSPVRPNTFGSNAAISFSSSFGLRQKMSNAVSKMGNCSRRDTSTGKRCAKVFAIREPDRLDCFQRRQRARGPDRQSGDPQHADEMDDVLREAPFRREGHGAPKVAGFDSAAGRHSRAPSSCASATSRAATSGVSAPMSS
jgi:hypothetical protein